MEARSFSGTLVSGTRQTIYLPDLSQGAKILIFAMSVENTTTLTVDGIKGFTNLLTWDNTEGQWEDGFEFGGDINLAINDFAQWLKEDDFTIEGGVKFSMIQSTGANVRYSGFILVAERNG